MRLETGGPAHGGAVVARADDGRMVFVRGALPGETVEARVTADHRKYLWAQTIDVLAPSPHRVPHIWPDDEENTLGAADLGFVAPDYQRVWKQDVLGQQLRRIGGEEVARQIEELHPDGVKVQRVGEDTGGTRTRIQLVADDTGRLGMHAYRSDRIVPVTQIPLADPAISDLSSLDPSSEQWRDKWNPGERVYIEAPSEGDPLVICSGGVFRLNDGTPFEGPATWLVKTANKEYRYSVTPGGFWQTHREAPGVLAEQVRVAAGPIKGQTVLELYSGAGLLSRVLADQVGPSGLLLSLEGNEQAVADAAANLNDAIEDDFAVAYQGNIDANGVDELCAEAPEGVDLVVLDPPRKGAGREVLDAVERTGTPAVILVSCDPAAAARDIRDLVSCGFMIETISAWDLFPGTHHFEIVTRLAR